MTLKRSFSAQFAHFKKHTLSGTLLFEKSKGQPFKTFARAQENKRSQFYPGFC